MCDQALVSGCALLRYTGLMLGLVERPGMRTSTRRCSLVEADGSGAEDETASMQYIATLMHLKPNDLVISVRF